MHNLQIQTEMPSQNANIKGGKAMSDVNKLALVVFVGFVVSVGLFVCWALTAKVEYITVEVPVYFNASHVRIEDNVLNQHDYEGWHKLPYSFNTTIDGLEIKVIYYKEVAPNLYEKVGEKTFVIHKNGVEEKP